MPKKIVITGGPGSGKTSLINHFESLDYKCIPEISRNIIIEAQEQGISQLFLEDPLLFSQKLLDGRLEQFKEKHIKKNDFIFFDRGLPDVTAYMDYIKTKYPKTFFTTCDENRYDFVFILPPWKSIYQQDNERYESFVEAKLIYDFLQKGYQKYNYNLIEVPTGTLSDRSEFIINFLDKN